MGSNHRATNVPEKLAQINYLPKVPDSGTNLAHNLAHHKIHTFVAYLKKKLKNLTTPIFLVRLIYRWGKGPKTKKYMYKYDFFLHNMGKKIFVFLTFLTF